jgi:hypothetical protein
METEFDVDVDIDFGEDHARDDKQVLNKEKENIISLTTILISLI